MATQDVDSSLRAAARVVAVPALSLVDQLGGSDRTSVFRATDGSRTYVVKTYHSADDDTWAREAAALEATAGLGVGPDLLGAADHPRLIVMADLGERGNLADALLARDADLAEQRLLSWVRAVATLHRHGGSLAEAYSSALAVRAPGRDAHDMPSSLARGADWLLTSLSELGVDVDFDLVSRMRTMPERFTVPVTVLSPGDACPDNNLVVGRGLRLLDFEFAEARHPAWDVAYLTAPWPSCWCAWRLPLPLVRRSVAVYAESLRGVLPYVDTAAFAADVDLATLGWTLWGVGLHLDRALREPADDRGSPRRPGRRSVILHRLRTVPGLESEPELTEVLTALRAALLDRWPDSPLALAPAFR